MTELGLKFRFCDSESSAIGSSKSDIILQVEEAPPFQCPGWPTSVENADG